MRENISIDERKRWLERAAHELDLGSADGMNLAELFLELISVSLPLVEILKTRWETLMENKMDLLLASQVTAYRAACIDYLHRRIEEMGQEVSAPVEPWSELTVYAESALCEKLMKAGERVMGVLATVRGVLTPEKADFKALRMAADIAADLMHECRLRDVEILEEAVEGLEAMIEILEPLHFQLPVVIDTLCAGLIAGDSKKASELLDKVKGGFAAAGRRIRWRIFEKQKKEPSAYSRCPSCASPYVSPSKAGGSEHLICLICAERFSP